MSFLSKILSPGKNSTREEALRLGMTVEEVERDIPYFESRKGPVKLKLGRCMKYSLKRASMEQAVTWSFLQRSEKEGAQFPNNWLFASPASAPSPPLRRVLDQIAKEWREEYLEFEGNEKEVSAFWEEWGGAEVANKIYQYLLQLSTITN